MASIDSKLIAKNERSDSRSGVFDDRTRAHICGLSNEALAKFLVTDGIDSEAAAYAKHEFSRRNVAEPDSLLNDARSELLTQQEILQRVNTVPFGFWDRVVSFMAGAWIFPLPYLVLRVIAAEPSEAKRALQVLKYALLGFGSDIAIMLAMMVYQNVAAPAQPFR